jgi:hypothetical protein
MNENKYHAAIYVPENLRRIVDSLSLRLRWTQHALAAVQSDKYGTYLPAKGLPAYCVARQWELFEVVEEAGRVVKFAVRTPYTDAAHLCIVVGLRNEAKGVGAVVTCWFNQNNDTHRSLDRAKYVAAPNK